MSLQSHDSGTADRTPHVVFISYIEAQSDLPATEMTPKNHRFEPRPAPRPWPPPRGHGVCPCTSWLRAQPVLPPAAAGCPSPLPTPRARSHACTNLPTVEQSPFPDQTNTAGNGKVHTPVWVPKSICWILGRAEEAFLWFMWRASLAALPLTDEHF